MAEKKNYGLGFSPLSVKNAEQYAFNEELVSQKEVGIFGIVMDAEKNIVSNEYLARTKYHLKEFVNRLLQDNTLGRIYKIRPNAFFATLIDTPNKNLLEGTPLSINNKTERPRGIRFNLDVDTFLPKDSALVHFNNVKVNIDLTLSIGENVKQLKITESLIAINSTAYKFDYTGMEEALGDCEISISNITIQPDETYDFSKYRMAVYDILAAVI